MGVKGGFQLEIKINGQQLAGIRNCVRRIDIVNNVLSVPCLHLELNDRAGLFNGPFALVDGTQIEISRGTNTLRTTKFVVLGTRSRQGEDCEIRIVTALLDYSSFFKDISSYAKRGTSLEIAADLCKLHGLKFSTNIKSCDDNMRWTSVGCSPRQFFEQLEQRMWCGEGSFPQTMCSEDGTVVLNDLNAVLQEQPVASFCHNYNAPVDSYLVYELHEKSISGQRNMRSGYGAVTRVTNDKGEVEHYSSAKVSANGTPNVSGREKSQLVGTKFRNNAMAPRSSGAGANVHANWFRAQDNWLRQLALYTEYVRVLVKGTVDLKPLTCVQLYAGTVISGGPQLNQKLSGKWVFAGTTETVVRNTVYTAVLLCRNHVGAKGTTELTGPNKAEHRATSMVDAIRPPQIDANVAQLAGVDAITDCVNRQTAALDKMVSDWASQAQDSIAVPELSEKYGATCDKLESLMSEFSAAQLAAKMCSALNVLEKLSVDFSLSNPGSILRMLDDRMAQMESLGSRFMQELNSMAQKGQIPETYLDSPKINARCAEQKAKDLQQAIDDKLGDRCLNGLSIDQLHGPSISLQSLYRLYEEWMRKFLCAFGGSTSGYSME